jgi:glycosyltransferase involved in cell wall biosynthesis
MTPSTKPLVTVAIPTRNRARLLRECLRSVLDQTLTDIEVFVSDNASTDDTAHVVASFNDPRLHYAPLEQNVGLYGNGTRCLRLGTAPYLAVFHDDDLMLPKNLERKLEVLERYPNVGIVHSDFHLIGADGQTLVENLSWAGLETDTIEPGQAFILRAMTESPWVVVASVVIRRSLVEGEQYEEADGPDSDLALWLRVARRADIAFLSEPLVGYRYHPDSETARQGLSASESPVPQMTIEAVAAVQQIKKRFLNKYGRELPDVHKVRAASRRWNRKHLLRVIKSATRRHHSPVVTWRLFLAAARVEPTLLLDPKAIRYLKASTVGSRSETRTGAHAGTRAEGTPPRTRA